MKKGQLVVKIVKEKKVISYPYISAVDDLFYARCPNCNYYDQYEFLAISRKKAILNWNTTMLAKRIA